MSCQGPNTAGPIGDPGREPRSVIPDESPRDPSDTRSATPRNSVGREASKRRVHMAAAGSNLGPAATRSSTW